MNLHFPTVVSILEVSATIGAGLYFIFKFGTYVQKQNGRIDLLEGSIQDLTESVKELKAMLENHDR